MFLKFFQKRLKTLIGFQSNANSSLLDVEINKFKNFYKRINYTLSFFCKRFESNIQMHMNESMRVHIGACFKMPFYSLLRIQTKRKLYSGIIFAGEQLKRMNRACCKSY